MPKTMTLQEIKAGVEMLSTQDLNTFTTWLGTFVPSKVGTSGLGDMLQATWDQQIVRDAGAGQLDELLTEAKHEIRTGQTRPL